MIHRIRGHLLALAVATIWGTTFISSKLLLDAFHPVELILYRFLLAWVILFLLSPKPLKPHGLKAELPFMAAGLTGLTLYFLFENNALTYTFASNCSIIISSAPMFAALILWLARRTRRPRWTFFVGFVMAIAGITILSLGGASLRLNPLGDLLSLGAALSWGLYGLCLEYTTGRGYTELQTTRKIFFWGLVFTALTLPLSPGQIHLLNLSRFLAPAMLFNLLYLAACASALSFLFWGMATRIIGPVATNLYLYLQPPITLTASALILREPITPTAVGATALIILGLWLSQNRDKPSPAPGELSVKE